MLRRKQPLRRQNSPLKRKTWLRPVSDKRHREMRVYSEKRKAFLAARPWCEAWLIVHNAAGTPNEHGYVWADDEHEGVIVTKWLRCPRATEVHHREKRGKNYLNEATWLAVCREMHERIENNKSWARASGLLK